MIEESFQAAKGQVGLDHYQCRKWTTWHRFTLMAMLALAILTAITARMPSPPNDDLIALTVPEIRRLINTLILARPPDLALAIHWSLWRRRHQATARTSHYQRQQRQELHP